MRMVVTAPKARVYGRSLVAGENFDCPDKEAKLWAALARAHPVSGIPQSIEVVEVDAEADIELSSGDGQPRKRRGRPPGSSYSRRDMRADEE